MAEPSAKTALADAALSFRRPEPSIRGHFWRIQEGVLVNSPYIRQPDFTAIHPRDLEFLFAAYDERFFGGLCRRALEGRKLAFRLSARMTRTGGTTTRFRTRAGEVGFEIAIASSMLFDAFREKDRQITVAGLECENRLEALQRILEHEVVHLTEMLCWDVSNCASPRFQDIAGRMFLHRSHTHALITRRERAANLGIRPGSCVSFVFEGVRLVGTVRRITKRATVLVPDPEGRKYSDGVKYKAYYVPLAQLEAVAGRV